MGPRTDRATIEQVDGQRPGTQADLVLEERAQRLDELDPGVLGEAADVVVALDVGRAAVGCRCGLDHVRINRALGEVGELFLTDMFRERLDK